MADQMQRGATAVHGHDPAEQRRLDLHGAFLRPHTERLFWDAGIGPGMRVLDAGCETGDVSLLLADLVGPSGEIVGVDRAADALATARRRAADRGLAQVGFVQADLASVVLDGPFDAIVGRCVLRRLPDPAGVLRHLVAGLRPGGIVAFQDIVILDPAVSVPPHPLFDRTARRTRAALAQAGASLDMGLVLPTAFAGSGLPMPEVRLDGVLSSTPDPAFMVFWAAMLRGMLSTAERFGAVTADEIGIDSLAARLFAEHQEIGGVICPILLGGAHVRTALI